MKRIWTKQKGFTLIELMLVVAVLTVLSSIATLKTRECIRRAQEARTRANLAMMRGVIAMYYTDTEGKYPSGNPLRKLVPKYLKEIPLKHTPPYHPDGRTLGYGASVDMTDTDEDWYLINAPGDPLFGKLVVNCNHRDLKGVPWSTY